jgi:hypothetical protein
LQLRDLRQKPGSSPVQGHSLRPPHDPDPNATAKSSATGNWYNTSHSQQNGWDSRTALPHPSHNDLDTYTILTLLQVAKTTETQTLQRISQRGMGTKMVKQIDNPMSLEKKHFGTARILSMALCWSTWFLENLIFQNVAVKEQYC